MFFQDKVKPKFKELKVKLPMATYIKIQTYKISGENMSNIVTKAIDEYYLKHPPEIFKGMRTPVQKDKGADDGK